VTADRLPVTRDLRRSARWGALGLSLARVGAGGAMLARPALLPQVAGVDRASSRRAGWMVRMLGVREVALGAGAAHAALTHRPLRAWLIVGALVDCTDAVSIAADIRTRRLPPVRAAVIAATAAGAMAAGLVAVRHADGPRRT
jgi:hypothetical protein